MTEFWGQIEARSNPERGSGDRELLRMILVGSPDGVREKIAFFHARGLKEQGLWSPLLPTPNPGEVMSICTCYRAKTN
ncbi:MAG: hypothetical protein HC769_29695 [Cyanobacteria bacterium CRU_2_1]|nr:hypothetical protein [Cyanobacteria bacterium RU_5_0]NJR62606.1 hypothetical protein [Cyanobacteria bacterium CRU_2_1]